MSGQIQKRNRSAVLFGNPRTRRQVFRHRVSKRDFTSLNHVSQQERSEHFADRPDLKYRVPIQRPRIARTEMAVRNNPPAFMSDDTDDDPDAIFLTSERGD